MKEEQQKTIESDSSEKPEQKPQVQTKAKGHPLLSFLVFINLIIGISLLVSLFFAYQQIWPRFIKSEKSTLQIDQKIEALQQQNNQSLNTQAQQWQETKNNLQNLSGNYENFASRTVGEINDLKDQIFLNKQQWVYADIHHLLSLATRRATLLNDKKGTKAALQISDDLLSQLDQTQWLPLRKSIFETLEKIDAVKEPNIEKLVFELQLLQKALLKRPQIEAEKKSSQTNETFKMTDSENSPGNAGFLSHFFSIKEAKPKVDLSKKIESIKATAPTKLDSQSLLIMFIQKAIQSALLLDQSGFEKNLEMAISKSDHAEVTAQLKTIKTNSVEIRMPDISAPLELFESLLKQQTSQPAEGER